MTMIPPDSADEIERIRKAMLRWKDMDAAGKKMGRGLGRRELIDRVALETGASASAVQSALKRG